MPFAMDKMGYIVKLSFSTVCCTNCCTVCCTRILFIADLFLHCRDTFNCFAYFSCQEENKIVNLNGLLSSETRQVGSNFMMHSSSESSQSEFPRLDISDKGCTNQEELEYKWRSGIEKD